MLIPRPTGNESTLQQRPRQQARATHGQRGSNANNSIRTTYQKHGQCFTWNTGETTRTTPTITLATIRTAPGTDTAEMVRHPQDQTQAAVLSRGSVSHDTVHKARNTTPKTRRQPRHEPSIWRRQTPLMFRLLFAFQPNGQPALQALHQRERRLHLKANPSAVLTPRPLSIKQKQPPAIRQQTR